MSKLAIVLLGMWLVAVPAGAFAQGPDDAAALRKEIELLKKEIELLKRENDLLKKENGTLRADATRPKIAAAKAEPAKTLPDLLLEGSVLKGTWFNSARRSGICSLTIKERSGTKFKGVVFHKAKDNQGESRDYEYEFEGTISAGGLSYRRLDTPNKVLASGKRKGDYLELDLANALGETAKATFKLPR